MTPTDAPDLLTLYRHMARVRAFELLLLELWREGRISGELHLGTGEEAVAAGLAPHLRDGDALALDHRPTPMMLLHGVDPVAIVREMLGRPDGLCGGKGGHMHLLDPARLAASSGIVGASAPAAAGFALAGQRLRPGSVALAFFGEGAANQGMVMETFNLAAVWRLPVLFVCKDNRWAITTDSAGVTAGDLVERAAAFGMPAQAVDGLDPLAVHRAAGTAVQRARDGDGPSFLLVRCSRLDGHMAGDMLMRLVDRPLAEGGETMRRVASSVFARGGGSVAQRAAGLAAISSRLLKARGEKRDSSVDPVRRVRDALKGSAEVDAIDAEALEEMAAVRAAALNGEVAA